MIQWFNVHNTLTWNKHIHKCDRFYLSYLPKNWLLSEAVSVVSAAVPGLGCFPGMSNQRRKEFLEWICMKIIDYPLLTVEKHDIVNKGKTRSRRLRSDAISSVFVGHRRKCRMKRDEEPPTDEQAESRSLKLNLMGLFTLLSDIFAFHWKCWEKRTNGSTTQWSKLVSYRETQYRKR